MPSLNGKTVAIYLSNKNHYSLLNILLQCLATYRCRVLLFVPENMEVSTGGSIVVHHEVISNSKFTHKKVFSLIYTADFFIVDQLYSFRELISFALFTAKRPNLLIVHDCNSWFNPLPPGRLINKVKQFLTNRISTKFGYFAVAGENMFTYVKEVLGITQVTLVPFRYGDFDSTFDSPTKRYIPGERLRIVIPGMITERRNYREMLDVLRNGRIKDQLTLVLLGKPDGAYGYAVLQTAKEMVAEGYQIDFWEEFIPVRTFDAEIKSAHVLMSYFDSEYQTDNGQTEIYGVSKETGVSMLMWNKAKVGILPAQFHQMSRLVAQTIRYRSLEDLCDILSAIYTGELGLERPQQIAVQNALAMDVIRIAENIDKAYRYQLERNHE